MPPTVQMPFPHLLALPRQWAAAAVALLWQTLGPLHTKEPWPQAKEYPGRCLPMVLQIILHMNAQRNIQTTQFLPLDRTLLRSSTCLFHHPLWLRLQYPTSPRCLPWVNSLLSLGLDALAVSSVPAQAARSTRILLPPIMNGEIVQTDVELVLTPVSVWYYRVLMVLKLERVSWTAFSQQPLLYPHPPPIAKYPPIILIQWTPLFIHRRWANKILLSDLSISQSWNAVEVNATVLMGDVVAELLVWDVAELALANQLALWQWKLTHNIFCIYFVLFGRVDRRHWLFLSLLSICYSVSTILQNISVITLLWQWAIQHINHIYGDWCMYSQVQVSWHQKVSDW